MGPATYICGRAATVQFVSSEEDGGSPCDDAVDFLDNLWPGEIAIPTTGSDSRTAYRGALFSAAARGRGTRGVVTDGSLRDVATVLSARLPGRQQWGSPDRCSFLSATCGFRSTFPRRGASRQREQFSSRRTTGSSSTGDGRGRDAHPCEQAPGARDDGALGVACRRVSEKDVKGPTHPLKRYGHKGTGD